MSIKLFKQNFRASAKIKGRGTRRIDENQRGAALVITLLVMILLLGFVAIALSRSASENIVSGNDASEARTFEASQAGLEDATRDFATIFETKLNPAQKDIDKIVASDITGFSDKYNFVKTLNQVGNSKLVTIQSKEFQGLYSLRDEWQIDVTATEKNSDVQVELLRRFYNNRIPLFQFGAFYNDDLELNRPPLFTFGGRVHTNSNFFVTANKGAGIYFKSKVTAAGEIINDIWKTGTTLSASDNASSVFFPDGNGNYKELTTGNASVKCTSGTGSTVLKEIGDYRKRNFPYPNCTKNTGWASFSTRFEGNLLANTPELRLPVDRLGVDLIEMMRRGKNVKDKYFDGTNIKDVTAAVQDDPVLSKERYANKPGLRISLADSQDELPQCVGVDPCGVRLDGNNNGSSPSFSNSIGYQPKPMKDALTYKTTALNGNRLAIKDKKKGNDREVWIKIEMVEFDGDTSTPKTTDVTEDILSLGVTEPFYNSANPYSLTPRLRLAGYSSDQDSRSIIKLQRFFIDGQAITPSGSGNYISNETVDSIAFNFAARRKIKIGNAVQQAVCLPALLLAIPDLSKCQGEDDFNNFAVPLVDDKNKVSDKESDHYKLLTLPSKALNNYQIVPFPIEMYDSREGNRTDSGTGVGAENVYIGGVMSLVDIDVANLRRFFAGEFNGKLAVNTPYAKSKGSNGTDFDKGLKSTDVPEERGWVVYFSDRRGDMDFDGRYDMEDVNPNSTSLVDEDVNGNKAIDVDTDYKEAPRLNEKVTAAQAAVTDHGYYRRGVRLINAVLLPGAYKSAKPEDTQGFTFASENGIYVRGNYNVAINGVTLPGGNVPAESTAYSPQDTADHIPSSIVGDSITILSNSWNDTNSFVDGFLATDRDASNTQLRFAMISGDSLTARTGGSNGDFDGLNGGIHNFLRFLESWNGKRLNYTGSMINLYNSYNNNGRWKCCTTVYDPPIRDWTFDQSFNDPNRLPPGSPYVYYLSLTGFERVNE